MRSRSARFARRPIAWVAARRATVGAPSPYTLDAGFADVDCLFKDHRFAAMVARKAR